MCAPAAIIGGLAVAQAVAGHSAQVQAATAANKQRAAQYERQKLKVIGQHNRDITNYYHKGVDAELAWAENAHAANLGAQAEQVKLNQAIAEAYRGQETDFIRYATDTGVAKSLEKTGLSAKRSRVAAKAGLGRARASRFADIDKTKEAQAINLRQIARAKHRADLRASQMIGLKPERGMAPPKPVFDKGPSMFSLVTNVAMAGVSGYQAGKDMGLRGFGDPKPGPGPGPGTGPGTGSSDPSVESASTATDYLSRDRLNDFMYYANSMYTGNPLDTNIDIYQVN
tara:strand:- start:1446 stop:2297 length:852 start_codon:yes stop_codon:yes gene_type:complete